MQLHFLKGIEQFQSVPLLSDRVQSYLLQHEAEHNLLLALLLRWIHFPDYPGGGTASHRFSEPPRIAIVGENEEILAIGYQPLYDWHEYKLSEPFRLPGNWYSRAR